MRVLPVKGGYGYRHRHNSHRHHHHIHHQQTHHNYHSGFIVSPFIAYFLGVLTCVVGYNAYNYFFSTNNNNTSTLVSVSSPRNRRKKNKSSPTKRKNRSPPKSQPPTPHHFLRPSARIAKIPIAKDKVYKRLSKNIRDRAANREKNKKRMAKSANKFGGGGGSSGSSNLAQCRGGGGRSSDNKVADVNRRHAVARNRASCNNKNSQKSAGVAKKKAKSSCSASIYNDVWSSSSSVAASYNEPTRELFLRMNAQPLHKKKDVVVSNETAGKGEKEKKSELPLSTSVGTNAKSLSKHVSPRKSSKHDKENVDAQKTDSVSSNANNARVVVKRSIPIQPMVVKKEEDFAARLTVLISEGVHDYQQAANQKATRDLLSDFVIPYDTVDGMDQTLKEKRDELFAISGVRGNYPQIFVTNEAGGIGYRFLGGYDWLNNKGGNDLKAIVSSNANEKASEVNISDTDEASANRKSKTRMVVLVSSGAFNSTQANNQKETIEYLDKLHITYETIDGNDPLQNEVRDEYFAISEIRGNYPQLFFSGVYLGGFEYIQDLKSSKQNTSGA